MKFSPSLTISAFFLCFTLGFSCQQKNAGVTESGIYYYPGKNIYYDSHLSKYYYSLDGARSWDSMIFKGAGYGTVIGPRIAIKKTGNTIWLSNEAHRKEYNGVLLNIINQQTISISKADSIKKLRAKVIRRIRPEIMEKEESPEKGLKKFLNKIFGKKKKPAEEKKQSEK